MKRINVRQLTREFKSIVRQLPIIITLNGKDRYILKELSDIVSDKPVKKVKVSDTKKVATNRMDFCKKHGVRKISCGCL